MKQALISFSFDDGRVDNYTIAYPILKRLKIPATFNITTGFVEGIFEKGKLTYSLPMNIDMVNVLFRDPDYEIACHGYWHLNTIDDIIMGVECLRKDLEVNSLGEQIGFASPGTSLNLDYYETIKKDLEDININYIRLSGRYLSLPLVKELCRKFARLLHLPFLFRFAYQDTLMNELSNNLLYSVPVMASTTISELKSLINKAVKEKKACVLMWHSIVPLSEIKDNFDFDVHKFETLCLWLKEMQGKGCLIMCKTLDIYNQLR